MDEKEKDTVRSTLKKQTIGYLITAFGLVAALAWNDAIKSLIEILFPLSNSNILIKFVYAVLVTILVVVIGQYILKMPPGNK